MWKEQQGALARPPYANPRAQMHPLTSTSCLWLDSTHISQAAAEAPSGGTSVEVEEVAEHAHSPRCRVSHFTVRWARTPPPPTPPPEQRAHADTVRGEEGREPWCPEEQEEEAGMRIDGVILLLAEASKGKVSPDCSDKVVVRARELHQHDDPSVRRGDRRNQETEGEIKSKLWIWESMCVYVCKHKSICSHVCLCARRCVCVSVCYVILSRPQLLSHTQQACWGSQPAGPLLPVSVFLHPSFLLSLWTPHHHHLFFPLIELAQYGFLISAGLLCKLRTRAFSPRRMLLTSVITQRGCQVTMRSKSLFALWSTCNENESYHVFPVQVRS